METCDDGCPVRTASRFIEGKWTTLIIRDLLSWKKRYSELLRSLATISPKMLAERLSFLEKEGMLTKTAYPTVPVTTEYELTELWCRLKPVLMAMAEFWSVVRSEKK